MPGGSNVNGVWIRLGGRVSVEVDGRSVDDAPLGHLGRLALGFLAAERHRPVSRDELADAIWGEHPPATWPDAVRGVVSRVRTVLAGAGLPAATTLTSGAGCYQLHLPAEALVDIEQAAAALDAARTDLDVDAAREAVALTTGQFLAGCEGEWVERRRRALADLHIDALEVLSAAATAAGQFALGAEAAEEAIGVQPLRESAYVLLAGAHHTAGNRGEALRAYERCRRTLAEELGVSPSARTEAMYLRLLTDDGPAPAPAPAPSAADAPAIPSSITSFVGRQQAIAEVRKHLGAARLLSLVGVGGVGKSRLALQVAGEVAGEYPQGIWLVELAALADPALVAPQVLSVVGAPEVRVEPATESLARHLGGSRMLLVLDNCEHLVGACASLADELLRRCPGLRILATSREALGVAGETIWPVPPLTAPSEHDADGAGEALLDYEAVRLFVERASAVAPELRLDDQTLADVAAVAARLEGIPLAIELAAAWAKVLSVAEIAQRLDDRFRLLVGGPRTAPARHQTLRAALDWSYESLSPDESAVLRRLSVFAGGCSLGGAESVCPAGVDVLDALSGLFDKSLVLVDRTRTTTRYRQLETVRQYAAERLVEAGEETASRNAHLRWAMLLAEAAEPRTQGPDQEQWLDALDAEHANLRAALDWAAGAGAAPETGARLAGALWRFWEIRGWLSEGRAVLSTWLERDDLTPSLRARLLIAAGILAQRQKDAGAARAWYEECVVIRRSLGEKLGEASALHGLANVAYLTDDLPTAAARFEENLEVARAINVRPMVAASLLNLGVIEHTLFMRKRTPKEVSGPKAVAYLTEALATYEALGDRHGVALALENLGTTSSWLGEDNAAFRYQEQSLALRRVLGDKPGIATSARYLSRMALRSGDCGMARGLSEECLAIERELGKPYDEAEALGFLAQVAMVEGKFDEARSLLDASIAMHRRGSDRPVPAWLLHALGEVATTQRDLPVARSSFEEIIDAGRATGSPSLVTGGLARLSLVALAEGDIDGAAEAAAAALADPEARARIWILSIAAETAADVAMDRSDAATAVRLLGASGALRLTFEPPAERPFLPPEHDRISATARTALGEEGFVNAWEAGAGLDRDQLAELLDRVLSRH